MFPCLHLQQSFVFLTVNVKLSLWTFMVSSNYSYDVACFIFSFIILKQLKHFTNDTIFMVFFHEVLLLLVQNTSSSFLLQRSKEHMHCHRNGYKNHRLFYFFSGTVQQLQLKQLLLTLPFGLYLYETTILSPTEAFFWYLLKHG
jgi:hypothetical protein